MALRARLRGSYPVAVEGVSPIAVTRTNGRDRITLDATEIPPEDLSIAVTGINGSSAYSQAHMMAAVPRRITSGSTVTVASNDSAILIDKSSVTTINLPTTASRAGLPLYVADLGRTSSDYTITIAANGSETINGSTSITIEESGSSLMLFPNAEAGKWTLTSDVKNLALNYCMNGNFSRWLSKPAVEYVETAGSGAGFADRAIADGWGGGPLDSGRYKFEREVYSAARGTFWGKWTYTASVSNGEAQHTAHPSNVNQRGTIIEYNARIPPSAFAGRNVTVRFKGKASGNLTIIPIIYISMGVVQWAASTAYTVGDYVLNGTGEFSTTQRVYRCTVAGTSAGSGGPTTTAASITDNTVTWTYVGEQKGRDYELFEAGGINTVKVAWGDGNSTSRCSFTTAEQSFTKTIYVPALNEGTGTTYSTQANDTGSRVFVPEQSSGAYTGIGFDFEWDGTPQGPTIYLSEVEIMIGAGVTAQSLPVPSGWVDAANNLFSDNLQYYSTTIAGLAPITSITQPAAGITFSLASKVYTVALANDLAALEGLASTGIARRTGTDTWSVGTTVTAAEGGTGFSSYTAGDMLYASGATTISKLAAGTTSQVLIGGTTPAWGTVPVAGGGTNITSYTAGDILYASGATTLTKLAAGTTSQVLRGGTTPAWAQVDLTTMVTGTLPTTNLASASQAEMEAATATNRLTTPGGLQNHPGVCKCWVSFTFTGTAPNKTPTASASWNVTSVSDDGVGKTTVTIATDFSSANYVVVASSQTTNSTDAAAGTWVTTGTLAAGSVALYIATQANPPVFEDPTSMTVAMFGDQ